MNKILFKLFFVWLFLTIAVYADDAKARNIMKKVNSRNNGKTILQDMQMILIDKHNGKRLRMLKYFSKDFGLDEYRMMFFISPSSVKNTAFLTYDYNNFKQDDDQWLYLPALKKIKRIPTADKSSSFMGSDFSYFDMTKRNLEDYDFKLLKEIKVRNNDSWVIEAIPRNSKVIKKSGYVKSIIIVRKNNYVTVREINLMKNGKIKYFDIPKMHIQNGIWLPDIMIMATKKGKQMLHKTVIKFSNIKVNIPLSDNLFTKRTLEKGI